MNLNDLTDVTLTGPIGAGTVLRYNGVNWVNQAVAMDDLLDADTTTTPPVIGQGLSWDGANWIPAAAAATTLDGLTDVTATGPAAGQTIIWDPAANAGAGGWILGTPASTLAALTDTDIPVTPTDGQVLRWNNGTGRWQADTDDGSVFLLEVGGVAGTAAVGDGIDVLLPTEDNFWLTQNRVVAVADTAPTGGPLVFDLIYEPSNTVITTGTFADGQTIATFSAMTADFPVADGGAIRIDVTAVGATTAGGDFGVVAQFRTPTAAAVPTLQPADEEVGEGSVLPPNDAQFELFRLTGHATLPDGLYFWNGVAWVQV